MLRQISAPRECLGALRCCKATSEPCCAFKDRTQSFSVESRHLIYLAMPMSLLGGNHLFQGRVHILLQPWNDTHKFREKWFESFCLQTRIICAASEASCAMHTGGYNWRSRLNKTKGNTITSHGINPSKRTSDKIRKGKTNK